jgi:cyclic pyranopterin phosphate synthase
MDLTFIEVMPMGDLGNEDRLDQYWSLKDLRARLAERFTLIDLAERTGGPARYVRLQETGQKIGFITPLTHNFCESCNRVRLTCTGELYMCLGQEDMADLRAPLRASTRRRDAGGRHPRRHRSASPRATISTIPARRWMGRSAGT